MVIDGSDPTPKYYQLKKHLVGRIERHQARVGDQLPPEDELARQYGVSRNTVRQALDVLEHEGYIERSHGRGTFVISDRPRCAALSWMVIVPDVRYPMYPELIRGIEDVARQNGISLILGNSDYKPEQQAAYIERARQERVAGVALSPVLFGEQNPQSLSSLIKSGIPLVFVVRGITGVDAPRVVCQNRLGGYLAAEHLVSLGHRRIAFISWPRYHVTLERYAGYADALREAGIAERAEFVRFAPDVDPGDPTWRDRAEGFVRRAAAEVLALDDPPTALFVPRDPTAFLVCEDLERSGRRVPEDISIVGFDALPPPEFAKGRLTSIAYPKYDSGLEAGKLLLGLSQAQEVPPTVELTPTLVVGFSTCPPVVSLESREAPVAGGGLRVVKAGA